MNVILRFYSLRSIPIHFGWFGRTLSVVWALGFLFFFLLLELVFVSWRKVSFQKSCFIERLSFCFKIFPLSKQKMSGIEGKPLKGILITGDEPRKKKHVGGISLAADDGHDAEKKEHRVCFLFFFSSFKDFPLPFSHDLFFSTLLLFLSSTLLHTQIWDCFFFCDKNILSVFLFWFLFVCYVVCQKNDLLLRELSLC